MKMHRILIYSLLSFSFWTENCIAQDTIYLDPKIEYFTKNGDSFEKLKKLKVFPKYSREKIQVSRDSFKLEYCYYFDNKRNTSNYAEHFKIIHDSILFTEEEEWFFSKKKDGCFCVEKHDSCFTEKGIAFSIIPFIKDGTFATLNKQNDTLLLEHFVMDKYVTTETPKITFKDSIYWNVDEPPKLPKKYGDIQNYISTRLIFPKEFAESCIQGKVYVKVVITSKGFVRNVNVLRGVDPLLDREALRVVSRLPEFEPAKVNGVNVNAYLIIPVKFVLQ